jgi:hypothetical protein
MQGGQRGGASRTAGTRPAIARVSPDGPRERLSTIYANFILNW